MRIFSLPEYQAGHSISLSKQYNEQDVTPFGAFREGDPVLLTVTLDARAGAYDFMAEFVCDDDGQHLCLPFTRLHTDKEGECYRLALPTEREGLYFYQIRYRDGDGVHYVKNPIDSTEQFQLTVYDRDYRAPTWFAGGIMYHIFVDRFARGGNCPPKPYAKIASDPHDVPQYAAHPGDPLANDLFFGGDLYGVARKLDYLKKLGVSCIYLSPIFDARSNHKYDTGNYFSVDSMFGGNEALDELLACAKERRIAIILDGVFNHTGDDSLYFNKYGTYPSLGAYQSTDSPYYNWYKFAHHPDRYAAWWGIPILPETNKDDPSFRDHIFGPDGVVPHYLRKGIAGWRLDVADELPEKFLTPLCRRAKQEKADALIIGEVWEDSSNKIAYSRRRKYFRGHQLDSVMNYPVREAVISFLLHGDGAALRRTVLTLYDHYPKCVSDNLMNILGTHDTARILTVLGAEPAEGLTGEQLAHKKLSPAGRERAMQALRCAYVLIATLPGVPCIYYGDEAGLEGYGDPFNRRFYPWGEQDPHLLAFYRKIGHVRRTHRAFAHGLLRFVEVGSDHVVYTRDGILIAVNRGNKPVSIHLDKPMIDLITDTPLPATLAPMSAVICK